MGEQGTVRRRVGLRGANALRAALVAVCLASLALSASAAQPAGEPIPSSSVKLSLAAAQPAQAADQGTELAHTGNAARVIVKSRPVLASPVKAGPELWWAAAGMMALGLAAMAISTAGFVAIVRRTRPASPSSGEALASWE